MFWLRNFQEEAALLQKRYIRQLWNSYFGQYLRKRYFTFWNNYFEEIHGITRL
jgi:hypothetical protein